MKLFFYPRLAITNIKKNSRIYFPYLLTSSFTVMMFYLIHSLSKNSGFVDEKIGSTMLPFVLELGTYVVIIFAFNFLFYINSFMMKRRKREFALYNILGMEKKHVMFILFYETLFVTFISLVLGILFGILFSQLMFLCLIKLLHLNTALTFEVPMTSLFMTLKIFLPIFSLSYVFNVLQIQLSKPIELLRGGEIGEKEPKVKWLFTIIGFVCLGSGYYIAQTIEDPTSAMMWFLIAVILVIIGTYGIFTSGSIMILKMLKKNKRFYYQTKHFTSVSQMLYRMKQNAVGLASICILCTCILVMLSSTVSLYLSVKDSTNLFLPQDVALYVSDEKNLITYKQLDNLYQKVSDQFEKENIEVENYVLKRVFNEAVTYENGKFIFGQGSDAYDFTMISAMSVDDYNRAYHKNMQLKDNEILLYDNFLDDKASLMLQDQVFHVKEKIDDLYLTGGPGIYSGDKVATIVFSSEKVLRSTLDMTSVLDAYTMSLDYVHENDAQRGNEIIENTYLKYFQNHNELQKYGYSYGCDTKLSIQQTYLDMFGSLFFLGIFLGLLFLMAAILIMYYKQLSEGYEDQKRFEIMQNVGMSQKEVKQTIRSQVLIFFFLPLFVAVIHMAFAFKMIVKMFSAIVLSEMQLFVWCTVISVIILAIIYSIIYFFTAKTYYRIVKH